MTPKKSMPMVVVMFRKREKPLPPGSSERRCPLAVSREMRSSSVRTSPQVAVEQHGVGGGEQQDETLENGVFRERYWRRGLHPQGFHRDRSEKYRRRCRAIRKGLHRVAATEMRGKTSRSTVAGPV